MPYKIQIREILKELIQTREVNQIQVISIHLQEEIREITSILLIEILTTTEIIHPQVTKTGYRTITETIDELADTIIQMGMIGTL